MFDILFPFKLGNFLLSISLREQEILGNFSWKLLLTISLLLSLQNCPLLSQGCVTSIFSRFRSDSIWTSRKRMSTCDRMRTAWRYEKCRHRARYVLTTTCISAAFLIRKYFFLLFTTVYILAKHFCLCMALNVGEKYSGRKVFSSRSIQSKKYIVQEVFSPRSIQFKKYSVQ